MLVDITLCIGCRKCEWACAVSNGLTDQSADSYESTEVFDQNRRMTANAYTVVNRFPNPEKADKPLFTKLQCMHCLHPACASACIVGALRRAENGAVTYDANKCMGCRYCMVACPFQVPAYEYDNAFTPQVRKCSFCFTRVTEEGKIPACAEMCPPMALTFGKRDDLLKLAHEKIAAAPNRYVPHVYGEDEVGGTAWLYLAPRPFEELGFLTLDSKPIPELTETIQHSLFRFGALPLMVFGLLGTVMRVTSQANSPAPEVPDRGAQQ